MASKKDPPPKNRPLTAAERLHRKITVSVAGLTLGGIGLLATRSDDTPIVPSALQPPAATQKDDTPPAYGAVRAQPQYAEIVRGERRVEVERILTTTHPIATVVEIKASDYANMRLECYPYADQILLRSVPQKAKSEPRAVAYGHSMEDPINALHHSVDQKDMHELLDQYRSSLRDGTSIPLLLELPKKEYQTQAPARTEDNYEAARDVTRIPADNSLLLRIDMGDVISTEYNWLKQLMSIPGALANEIEHKAVQSDAYTMFVSEVVRDPQTGKFDARASDTLLRIFSLTDEDRKNFSDSLLANDYERAAQIIANKSSESPVNADLFATLQDFMYQARRNGASADNIKQSIVDVANVNIYRGDNQNCEESQVLASNLLYEMLSPEQLEALHRMPQHIATTLAETFADERKHPDYHTFVQELEAQRHSGQLPAVPIHILQSIQSNLPVFLGNGIKKGWIDSSDRERNLISILVLLKQQDHLRTLGQSSPDEPNRSPAERLIDIKDGKAYLTLQIPTTDLGEANRILASVSRIMRSMHAHQTPLSQELDKSGSPKPLRDRIDEFFSREAESDITRHTIASPCDLITPLALASEPNRELQQAVINDNTPNKNIRISKPEIRHEMVVRQIERCHTESRYTSTVRPQETDGNSRVAGR